MTPTTVQLPYATIGIGSLIDALADKVERGPGRDERLALARCVPTSQIERLERIAKRLREFHAEAHNAKRDEQRA